MTERWEREGVGATMSNTTKWTFKISYEVKAPHKV